MKKTLKINSVKIIEIDGLDIDLKCSINPNYGDDDNDDVDIIYSDNMMLSSDPIEINVLQAQLTELQKQGSNYVSLIDHLDHHGYVIEGLNIQEVDNEQYDVKLQSQLDDNIKIVNRYIDKFVNLRDDLTNDKLTVEQKLILFRNYGNTKI